MESDLPTHVDTAYDRDAALDYLSSAQDPYDIVIADLWMPDSSGTRDTSSGLKILEAGRAADPPSEVMIITGNSSADTALRASLTGAREYIVKPIEYDRLMELVREITREREAAAAPAREFDEGPAAPIVGASLAMIDVMKTLGRVAPTDATVLIQGESGCGKELVAKAIHANSRRAGGPFVVVNCSAIAENLIEAELFGIGRRVATEVDARPGKFMEADGGTIFLDEIGDMALPVQPKILRAIEEGEIQRVGASGLQCDVRVIAATNHDLESAAHRKEFRRDLYYRLAAVTVRVPPLRERRDDIALLADHFLRSHARALGKPVFGFDRDVLPRLMAARWEGNVRELKNAVETAVVRCPGSLARLEDLPRELVERGTGTGDASGAAGLGGAGLLDLTALPLAEATAEFERRLIAHVLTEAGGNVTQAAARLGIGRTALHRKIRNLGVRRAPDDAAS
jgi:DNA-binding NtrC family response regulator